ncbi:exodeoxyribonuclease VII large subunit [Rhodoligotrophos defluvii]|uniref:exodeoxyribonuclease VII large subunit n=1 Tax=Rhodoligotrophos defluvii TaxID=2561934 RepID=UPI0010C9A36F|nr:exodeoxyribonuclease VII large subunit [Rhodoligotrophos defluvii]
MSHEASAGGASAGGASTGGPSTGGWPLPETPPDRPAANVQELTVSELSHALKRTVEDRFAFVRVRGEISGFKGRHASGHCYFSLKDEGAKIEAVIWRSTFLRLRFKPQEGLEVIATGRLTTYPNSSKYQIVIDTLEPAGVGALMALLDERRRKLAAEGLFDAARKVPIPFLPQVIGVVTSPTGAVIRDILHRLSDRFPRHVLVWPVRVQGETCAAEVAAAIRGFNAIGPGGRLPRPDVIIVARGGGSLEDLWGFNEEEVVRAAAASEIPLISAVGHETDTTLIDFAADLRCPTPTAAAECAVPVRQELLGILGTLGLRHHGAMRRVIDDRRTRVRSAARGLPRPQDLLSLARQSFDMAAGRLVSALRANTQHHRHAFIACASRLNGRVLLAHCARERERLALADGRVQRAAQRRLAELRQRLDGQAKLLNSLGYESVLSRGYVLVLDEGHPVRKVSETCPGQAVTLRFQDGEAGAVIGQGRGNPAASPPVSRRKKEPSGSSGQGELF